MLRQRQNCRFLSVALARFVSADNFRHWQKQRGARWLPFIILQQSLL